MTVAPPSNATLIVVDDDTDFLRSLELALSARNFTTIGFADSDALVESLPVRTADCVLLDLIMPGVSGLDLLKTVRQRRPDLPVIVMSGMGSIAIAVEAMGCGAADFIEKPFELDDLVARLERRLVRHAQRKASVTLQRTFGDFPGFQSLTGREHEVLAQIALGASSKEAGRTLGISPRTVDVHRARIKEKLQVRRAVDLVRLVYASGKS